MSKPWQIKSGHYAILSASLKLFSSICYFYDTMPADKFLQFILVLVSSEVMTSPSESAAPYNQFLLPIHLFNMPIFNLFQNAKMDLDQIFTWSLKMLPPIEFENKPRKNYLRMNLKINFSLLFLFFVSSEEFKNSLELVPTFNYILNSSM